MDFDTRIAVDTALVQGQGAGSPSSAGIKRLKNHVSAKCEAVAAGEPGRRSFLLGNFHVCLAECAGNAPLAEILRYLTTQTTRIATLFQSTYDATQFCDDHALIAAAPEIGDIPCAIRIVGEHIATAANHRDPPSGMDDPLTQLRCNRKPPLGGTTEASVSAGIRRQHLVTDPSPGASR